MADRLQLVNSALREVGADPISSLDDGTYNAKLISDIYELSVQQVMIASGWTCLRTRAILELIEELPLFGFEYSFQMPTDPKVIQLLEFNKAVILNGILVGYRTDAEVNTSGYVRSYQVEGDRLYTNSNVAQIVYKAADMNEANWDIHFSNTVVSYLKYRIAANLNAEIGKINLLYRDFDTILRLNKNNDNIQASSVELVTDTYFIGRYYE